MSLVAQVWANNLPLDLGVNYAAYRVLGKLCDAHQTETNAAWRNVDRLAAELRCSKRTVQRAFRDLKILGLITEGNQRLLPADHDVRYRPTVWTIALDRWTGAVLQPELEGMTTVVTPKSPVDNPPRGDKHAAQGVTTVVVQGTGRTDNSIPSATTGRANRHAHTWRWTSVGNYCSDSECGLRDDGLKRIDWNSMRITPVRRSA